MISDELEKKLFRDTAQYGDKYVEHLLEQYKLYLASAEKISDRRQTANSFFLGLNTALLGLLGWLHTSQNTKSDVLFVAASVAAGLICFFWYRMMRSYRDLNSAKFEVIHAIEKRLPLSMYDVEWDVLQRGTDRSKYWPFSHIEMNVPLVFIGIYPVIILAELVRMTWPSLSVFFCR